MKHEIKLEIGIKDLKISSENAPSRIYELDRWEIGSAIENYLHDEIDCGNNLVIKNRISGVITDFFDSVRYYSKDIKDAEIEDIYDLCKYLNSLDMYGCGSSFEVLDIE